MNYFYAIVHHEEGSAYGVTFPDLPGCFSAADEEADLLPNACEALDLWFEDQPEPARPLRLDEVTALAARDLRDGAFLIAVPRIGRGARVERVNVSLDNGILAAIDRAAVERSLTRSGFIALAARNEIEHRH